MHLELLDEMKNSKYSRLTCLLVLIFFFSLFKLDAQDALIDILKLELNREMNALKNEEVPPYYLAYRVNDDYIMSFESSFGSLVNVNDTRTRMLTTDLRVGDYELDNSHPTQEGLNMGNAGFGFGLSLPLEDSSLAVRQLIWQATNSAYLNAVSTYSSIKNKLKEKDTSNVADFSKENPVVYFEPPVDTDSLPFNKAVWKEKIKKYSTPFLEDSSIISGNATVRLVVDREYFVSSEGSSIAQNQYYIQLQIEGIIKSDDGNILPAFKSFYSFNPSGLPDDSVIMKDVHLLVEKLKLLKAAKMAEPYSGPAILSQAAAAVFFHEIFGHRIEGERLRNNFDSQTFKNKVGSKVLPKFMTVVSDPTLTRFNGQDLIGHYKYDEEGVAGQRVLVVNKGILDNFLMSRSPLEGFPRSNGHGRAQAGYLPVARQSNLLVETSNPKSDKELRKMLIRECKKEGKEYGYYFKQVTGGFTMTDRSSPNVFNVTPTEVYRIYVDGRPDELVRGVDLIGTPLTMFSEIEAAGDHPEVFTGYCGAESGGIPVTAISPSLFVRKIETQKKPESSGQLPVLPRPDSEVEGK